MPNSPRRYGRSLVLLERYPAAEYEESAETLDLVRIGADDSPHWSGVWPTSADIPRHARLKLCMAAYDSKIVGTLPTDFDLRQDEDD